MTEDSTLFSLDQLTKTKAASQPPLEEDSGLIDIAQLSALAGAPVPNVHAPPPLSPLGAPPLGTAVQESTLNGLSATGLRRPSRDRFRIGLVATAIVALALAMGWSYRRAVAPAPSAGPAPTIIVFAPAAPAPRPEATVNDTPGRASTESVAPLEAPRIAPAPSPRRVAPKAKVRTETPKAVNAPPKRTPKDPCSHCGGDLACAMRCSVRGSR